MSTKVRLGFVFGMAALGGLAMVIAGKSPAQTAKTADAPKSDGRDADREAIRKTATEFAHAFNQGDAKAVAAFWTDGGEYINDSGESIQGRAAIEKTFAELFKDKSQGRIEAHIGSIRFPSRDVALEEGVLRHTPDAPGLPSSMYYRTIQVREDGKWKIALSQEWGSGEDRLGDLDWLIGTWEGGPKGQEVKLAFEQDPAGPFIRATFTKMAEGKVAASGKIQIGVDVQRGQLRSWHFDDDGGHGQSLWIRDGNRWVLDAIGVQADGTETAAVNILARVGNDEITWRSIDRVAGDEAVPDTVPIKLKRLAERK
jgi:uncharacterized protein (TIGR02246 family)